MGIEKLLKHGFAGVVLVLTATAGYLQGRGAAQLAVPMPTTYAQSKNATKPPAPPVPFDCVASPTPTPFRAQPPVVEAPSTVARAVTSPAPLLRSLRVVPEQQDGKLVGLRLFGIRPGSLLSMLGLQNGDRLESINGFDITNPEKALEAYARLRTATRLSVRVVRLGRPLQIDLNIV